ncbi:alpha/beta hydrolase [Pseudomonas cerasi]|uniref:Lysophospholipase n=1 Tax=Pseudomonas cerasi TaxID=1583341 RepID=A0A193SVD9_9PSED|nr:alpha/beta hydrolase [Pseudomonas cerasi]CZT30157.1 lysophospholipase [Pseudomonas cerasi]SOS21878.1 lysophospholipase [Pseudomonas cerasi]
MEHSSVSFIDASAGRLAVHEWTYGQPKFLALLVHGYGEHLGRYDYVAQRLTARGARVFGPDHQGHGQSDGERALITDYAAVIDDLHLVTQAMMRRYPDLPLIVIGHSMGGLIATHYAQLHGDMLAALVLSGPLLGKKTTITSLLDLPEIPNTPLDVRTLSRDPDVGRLYTDDQLIWHGPFKRSTLLAMREVLHIIHSGPTLGDLPTLWLHGGADDLVKLEESRITLDVIRGQHFDSHIYPGARHEIFNEINRDAIFDQVLAFIETALSLPSHRLN